MHVLLKKKSSVDQRSNERAARSAGRDSDWLVSARAGDGREGSAHHDKKLRRPQLGVLVKRRDTHSVNCF